MTLYYNSSSYVIVQVNIFVSRKGRPQGATVKNFHIIVLLCECLCTLRISILLRLAARVPCTKCPAVSPLLYFLSFRYYFQYT